MNYAEEQDRGDFLHDERRDAKMETLMEETLQPTKFQAGCYVTTYGVQGAVDKFLPEDRVTEFFHGLITRHLAGDWGDACEEDKQANEKALQDGGMLMSVYKFNGEFPTLWVITEWDRSVCTILLPSEY